MGIFRQFPYSNFHDMNLDSIIKIVREMQDEWAKTKTEWASYKDFIDNYFENLDLSQEVLTQLRAMLDAGELDSIIDPTISSEVAAWLSEHITPTTPIIDNSLSISGAGADAKVAGDYLRNLDGALVDSSAVELSYTIGWDNHAQRYNEGNFVANPDVDLTNFIDISKYKYLKYTAYATTAASTVFGIAFFEDNLSTTYISGVQGYVNSDSLTMKEQWAEIPVNAKYARFTVLKNFDNFYIKAFPNINDLINNIKSLNSPTYDNTFVSGSIVTKGNTSALVNRIRNTEYNAPEIQAGDYVYFSEEYAGRIAIFREPIFKTEYLITWIDSAFTSGYEFIPSEYAGYYCGITIRKVGYETEDISEDVATINNYVKYYRASRNPMTGKKLSVLGDSISAMQGYIPTGYDAFYNGSNYGVTEVNQMWWKILADVLGMQISVINAYSGSAVTQLEDESHINKIPMSSDERTAGLGSGDNTPDVIIIAGGVNDYTYARSAQSEPLEWDGKTAPVINNSFTEAYACMIKKIQTNYPDAIIIALSTFFTMRGSDNGYTLTHSVGDNVYTQNDYDNAIKSVCDQMRIPCIDIINAGFNRNNYYPQYAEDSDTAPTHPNANGQRVIGITIIEKIKDLITGYLL